MHTFMAVIVFECRQITIPSSPFSRKNFVQPPSVFRCCSGCKSTVLMSLNLKGEKMLVADTLSRAYLPEVNSRIFFSGAGRG